MSHIESGTHSVETFALEKLLLPAMDAGRGNILLLGKPPTARQISSTARLAGEVAGVTVPLQNRGASILWNAYFECHTHWYTSSLELPPGVKRQRRPPKRYNPYDYMVSMALEKVGGDGSDDENEDYNDDADGDFEAEDKKKPSGKDDSDGEQDLKGPQRNNRRFVDQQRKVNELDTKEDHFIFDNAKELAMLVSENLPDDETRHRLVFFRLPPNKRWREQDLTLEFYFHRAAGKW